MPIDILRVRDDDIPGLVMEGVVDLGIIGENVLEEVQLIPRRPGTASRGQDPQTARFWRLPPLAVPDDVDYQGLRASPASLIATSYPQAAQALLRRAGPGASRA